MRKAKIVCTIGPASNSRRVIQELIKNGMDVARLNFSHGDYESHKRIAEIIREEAVRNKRVVSILQDLQGIKIRLTEIEGGEIFLNEGDEVYIHSGEGLGNKERLFISYPALLKDVKVEDLILIDDGIIKLIVVDKTKKELKARVIEGGVVRSKKGVNLPTTRTSLSSFTEKDKKDLAFGIKFGVDYVALSFIRSAKDIKDVLKWAKIQNIELPPLIAKIEKPEALDNIDEIIDIVDGIMVARGDLGVEMPTEKVPIIQKMLIKKANQKGKLVITATQMLESMTQHTRPTRAEATDVANAVIDNTDALMLSAETAAGKYPVEALKMMGMIIEYTEKNTGLPSTQYELKATVPEAIADGACEVAHNINAKAIVVFTHSGFTASLISKLRPNIPILAFTPDEKVLKRLPLYWGVIPKFIEQVEREIDQSFIEEIGLSLKREKIAHKGDNVVFVASSPFLGRPNVIRVHKL
jgi:pyruvate kinase